MTLVLNTAYVDLLDGDHLAALMLGQIVYWCSPDKQGKTRLRVFKRGQLWLVKSHTHWWEELRLTRRQSQRCLEVLKARGLIKTELHRYDGHATVHLQLIAGPEHLKVQPGCTPKCNVAAPSSATKLPLEVQLLTETTTETTATTTGQAPAVAAPSEEDQQMGKTAAETLKAFQEKQQPQGLSKGPMAMQILWKKHQGLESGGYAKPLTGQETGQLRHVHKNLGDQAYPVLQYALENWQKFASEASAQKGVTCPNSPSTGFFCAHYEVAVQLIAQPVEHTQAKPVPLIVKPTPVADNPDLATAEDVAETMAQIQALIKGK